MVSRFDFGSSLPSVINGVNCGFVEAFKNNIIFFKWIFAYLLVV